MKTWKQRWGIRYRWVSNTSIATGFGTVAYVVIVSAFLIWCDIDTKP